MSEFTYDLIQNGMVVASVTGSNILDVRREIWHYAMVYAQDGPVTIRGANTAALAVVSHVARCP